MSQGLLRFEQVTLVRGGRVLFRDLDLRVGAGEALQVAGPNGAGKSSLIRLAAGLLDPAEGLVERSALALSDEKSALDPELPLSRALAFWAGVNRDKARIGAAMSAIGISHLSDVPVRLLSTGQLKRAALARVAALPAPLWLLDEPMNGLDASGIAQLGKMIADHRSKGGAVVAASHQPLPGSWARLELVS